MATIAPASQCARLRQELLSLQRELDEDVQHLQQLEQEHGSPQEITEWTTTVSLKTEEVEAARRQLLASGCLEPTHPPPPAPHVAVTGVEVTQAIQDPGNAIPLVNGKTTVVRVYVKSTIGVAYPNVHGQLTVSGSGVGAHNPVNASSITASPTGSDRRSLADSFAFLLDATETGSGSRSISVQLFDGDPARNMRLGNTTLTVQFSAPDLRFHTYGVTYGYTDVDPATGPGRPDRAQLAGEARSG